MKAAVLYAPGDLRYEDVPDPSGPAPDEAIVRVKSAGICGSDIDRVTRTGTYRFPCIPGHEFCGEVQETGRDVSEFRAGDRVVVAPILPCFRCEACQRGDFGLCDSYDYLGSRRDGAFAQYVKAPARNLVRMPDGIGFDEGAAVEPAAVTLHGVKRAGIQAGDCAAVFGCGTIGLFAVQFARILGASSVAAIDVDASKLELAKKAGAAAVINSAEEDPIEALKALTKGRMADVSIETAGVGVTQEQVVRAVRKGGRILFLGTAHRDVVFPPKTFERIVRGELTATGSWNSFSAPFPGKEWSAVLEYLGDGRLQMKPYISHVFPLEKAPETIAGMAARKFAFTKILLRPETPTMPETGE
jgi:L-iditol 2-dehydrogenase